MRASRRHYKVSIWTPWAVVLAASVFLSMPAVAQHGRGSRSGAGGSPHPPPGSPAPPGPPASPASPQGTLGPFLGAVTEDVSWIDAKAQGVPAGARVLSVVDGSPAAGVLKPGDIVVSVATRPVGSARELVDRFSTLPAGQPVALGVRRGRADLALQVTPSTTSMLIAREDSGAKALVGSAYVQLAFRKPPAAPPPAPPPSQASSGSGFLGVSVEDNPNGADHDANGLPRGAMVRGLLPGSAAASAGVIAGDVITWAGGKPVGSAVELTAIVSALPPGTVVQLVVQRNGTPLTLNAQLASKR